MVMPGQFLERPTLVESGGFCLEGLWHRGQKTPALLILSPHPAFGGGSMDFPLSLEIAWAATRRGHATLRFNWRGVGASQGTAGGLDAAIEDAERALRLLQENVSHGQIAVAGIAFGAEAACQLALRHSELTGILLAAPSRETLLRTVVDSAPSLMTKVCVFLPGRDASDSQQAQLAGRLRHSGVELDIVPEANSACSEGLVQMGEAIAARLDDLAGDGGQVSADVTKTFEGASGQGEDAFG